MKTFINCALAYFCGWARGLFLGFYDCAGLILYDFGSGLRAGALFACAFAIAALWGQLFYKNKD